MKNRYEREGKIFTAYEKKKKDAKILP